MLRGCSLSSLRALSSSFSLVCSGSACAVTTRSLHTTCITFNSSANSNRTQQNSAAEEDREELERERQLREQFARKIQQGLPSQQGGSGAGAEGVNGGFGSAPGWGTGSGGGGPSFPGQLPVTPDMARKMFNFLFYLTALLLFMLMVPLVNTNSSVYTMQGLPWWELPIGSAAYFLLLRALYPRSEQNRIKAEFEKASRASPTLTFEQFITNHYPTMFQGYRTSQPEVVAAVSACLSSAKDLHFAKTMVRAAGRARDPRSSTDDIMDALRRDFPQLF